MLRKILIIAAIAAYVSANEEVFSHSDCQLGVERGPVTCDAIRKVYHWNDQKHECEEALYGGCRATKNNFRTLEDCQNIAKPVCQK